MPVPTRGPIDTKQTWAFQAAGASFSSLRRGNELLKHEKASAVTFLLYFPVGEWLTLNRHEAAWQVTGEEPAFKPASVPGCRGVGLELGLSQEVSPDGSPPRQMSRESYK